MKEQKRFYNEARLQVVRLSGKTQLLSGSDGTSGGNGGGGGGGNQNSPMMGLGATHGYYTAGGSLQ